MRKKFGKTICGLMGVFLLCTGACTTNEDNLEQTTPTPTDREQTEQITPEITPIVEASVYAAGVTQRQLFDNEFIVYYVNCATENTTGLADGDFLGLFQSKTDQAFALDTKTNRSWGYVHSEYMTAAGDLTAKDRYSASWEINTEIEYTDQTGFYYDFELPAGQYEITCGFYDPFSTRKVDISAEGELQISQEKIFKYKVTEHTFVQEVTDGTLNLCVNNTNRGKDTMKNPILTYIIIKAVPEYDKELLECLLERQEGLEQDRYTLASITKWEGEVEMAMETVGKTEATKAEYKERYEALRSAEAALELASIKPGEVWKDTEGVLIQAHGGQIQKLVVTDSETGEQVEKWWWVGEDKTLGYRGGINAYSSTDLINWTCEGTVMRNVSSREQLETEQYFIDLYGDYTAEQLDNVYRCINDTTSVIERPKMIYNEKTGKYVLWFHADGPTETSTANYAAASAGVAISDSPTGPFQFIDRYRLNTCPEDQEDYYPQSKGMARDMNLFIDDDGTAYIIYSSEENLTLYISKLNDEYTYLATDPKEAVYGEDFIRIFAGWQREAPALFKRNGKYYLMTSGCTGWSPNPARYAIADSIFGEWTDMGDPCVDDTSRTTFYSQSTCIFCYDEEQDFYIYMGDRWNSDDLTNSRYIWLPVEFDEAGNMSISYVDEWLLP